MTVGSFDDYVESLSQLSNPFDPTVPTAESEEIRTVATQLAALGTIDRASLAEFIRGEADAVHHRAALGAPAQQVIGPPGGCRARW